MLHIPPPGEAALASAAAAEADRDAERYEEREGIIIPFLAVIVSSQLQKILTWFESVLNFNTVSGL